MSIAVVGVDSSVPSKPLVRNGESLSKWGLFALRVKNFVSKYFIEPFEYPVFCISPLIRCISWIKKNIGNILPVKLFHQTQLVDEKFKESIYFKKLQKLDPLLADPMTAKQRIDDLNGLLKLGTCYGQSVSLLKDPKGLDLAIPATEPSDEVIFLQCLLNQNSLLKSVIEIKKALIESGWSIEGVLTPSGQINEAVLFDCLRKEMPNSPRFFIRVIISQLDPATLKLSDAELSSRAAKLSSALNDELSTTGRTEFIEKFCLAGEGTQKERDQKITDFFQKNKGNFIFASEDQEVGIGHAIFVRHNDSDFRAYDPTTGSIYRYKNAEEGVKRLIEWFNAALPKSGVLTHWVSVAHKISSASYLPRLAS